MVAIARAGVARDAATVTPKRSSPNLDAQLRTYRAQLADWVTCPSAKTPEGKAKIEQISAKLNSVKSEIKKSDGTSPSATTAPQTMPNDSTRPADGGGDYLTAPSQVGANVDTYA
jgi:hypothetical protein